MWTGTKVYVIEPMTDVYLFFPLVSDDSVSIKHGNVNSIFFGKKVTEIVYGSIEQLVPVIGSDFLL